MQARWPFFKSSSYFIFNFGIRSLILTWEYGWQKNQQHHTTAVFFLANTYLEKTKTIHKEKLSENALLVPEEKIEIQRKLYDFIKTRFYKMVNAVRRLKALSNQ